MWPGASNTGPVLSTLRTTGGVLFASAEDFTGHASYVGGAGTLADPHVIERHRFTDGSLFGDYDPSTLSGKVYKLRHCYLGGLTSTGDLDGLAPPLGIGINARVGSLPARVILEDCELGPASGSPVPAGGPDPATGGLGYTIAVNSVPLDMVRCSVWGGAANINIVNGGTSAPRSTWTDCWWHDQWVSGGAHTDGINGADPTNASNVSVIHNVVDGKCGQRPVGGAPAGRIVNAFGIYNTQAIAGWYIRQCLIKNADFGIFWAPPGVGGAMSDMQVTDNQFDLSNLGSAFSGRAPNVASGNVDQNGDPIAL